MASFNYPASGSVSAQTTFTRNSVTTSVTLDTTTPANNRPLPVLITGGDGAGNPSESVLMNAVALTSTPTAVVLDTKAFTTGIVFFAFSGLNNSFDLNIKLQYSYDGSTNWTDINDATYTAAAASGNDMFRLWPIHGRYLRVVVTRNTVTTGTLTVAATLKGL